MKILIIVLLIIATAGCTAPNEPTVDTHMDIDSLLGVIDTLNIQVWRQGSLIRCFRATLDTLNMTTNCKLGY